LLTPGVCSAAPASGLAGWMNVTDTVWGVGQCYGLVSLQVMVFGTLLLYRPTWVVAIFLTLASVSGIKAVRAMAQYGLNMPMLGLLLGAHFVFSFLDYWILLSFAHSVRQRAHYVRENSRDDFGTLREEISKLDGQWSSPSRLVWVYHVWTAAGLVAALFFACQLVCINAQGGCQDQSSLVVGVSVMLRNVLALLLTVWRHVDQVTSSS
jgi:predicted phage tail protein